MAPKRGFARFDLPDRVQEQLPKIGFIRPTKVQARVIPLFLQGLNVIVEAPTGTGKTAAYGLPLIARLDLIKRSTQALIMAPSRELVLQISRNLRSYFDGEQLQVGSVYGGVSMGESFEAIRSAPHILVAVPGRLKDVMAHYKYDFLWRDIKYLVIDEGDKLLEQGFQRELDDILIHLRRTVQVGVFSATISKDAESQVRERVRPIKTIRLSPKEVLHNIRFTYAQVKKGQRESYLAGMLKQYEISKALIFCARRQDIQAVTRFLRNVGFRAEAYFGSQEQTERQNILKRFRDGHIHYLVASDLAARGLDIEDLPAVINMALPSEFDYYLHRVGRTGRAGRKGEVYNLVSSEIEAIRLKKHHKQIQLPIRSLEVTPWSRSEAQIASDHKWVKAHFSRGKKDKIRKGDIVGFLIHQTGVDPEAIGTITVYDSYSVVDLPQENLKQLASPADPLKIKGKSLKVRKFQLEEQERKARAIKRLKKDRKESSRE